MTPFHLERLMNCIHQLKMKQKLKCLSSLRWKSSIFQMFKCIRLKIREKPKTLISMIGGFLSPSPNPKTNYLCLWRPQESKRNQENTLKNEILWLSRNFESPLFVLFRKGGHRKMMTLRLKQISQILDLTNIYLKTWNDSLGISNTHNI